MKGGFFKIHPLFLLLGISFYAMKNGELFWHIVFCWMVQESGKIIFCLKSRDRLQKILLTPVGVRGDFLEGGDLVLKKRVFSYFAGSVTGIFLALCLFAFERQADALLSLLLACLRLIPVLPLDGGNLLLCAIGRWRGTLQTAAWLTKAGRGIGYGLWGFGVIYGAVFFMDFTFLLAGAYLVYVNKREFLKIAQRLYENKLEGEEHPLRQVTVTGEESPLDLALRLNPYENTIFVQRDGKGVSQERALLSLFLGRSAKWMWQVARGEEKDFRAKTAVFGYHKK